MAPLTSSKDLKGVLMEKYKKMFTAGKPSSQFSQTKQHGDV